MFGLHGGLQIGGGAKGWLSRDDGRLGGSLEVGKDRSCGTCRFGRFLCGRVGFAGNKIAVSGTRYGPKTCFAAAIHLQFLFMGVARAYSHSAEYFRILFHFRFFLQRFFFGDFFRRADEGTRGDIPQSRMIDNPFDERLVWFNAGIFG